MGIAAWLISAAIVCTGRVQIDGLPHDCTGKVESFTPKTEFEAVDCWALMRQMNKRWHEQNIHGFAKCVPADSGGGGGR